MLLPVMFVCAGIVTGVLVNCMGVSRIVWCVYNSRLQLGTVCQMLLA
jgi:hypothetical protein